MGRGGGGGRGCERLLPPVRPSGRGRRARPCARRRGRRRIATGVRLWGQKKVAPAPTARVPQPLSSWDGGAHPPRTAIPPRTPPRSAGSAVDGDELSSAAANAGHQRRPRAGDKSSSHPRPSVMRGWCPPTISAGWSPHVSIHGRRGSSGGVSRCLTPHARTSVGRTATDGSVAGRQAGSSFEAGGGGAPAGHAAGATRPRPLDAASCSRRT